MSTKGDRRDPRVDEYIDGLPDWQRAVCREVREVAHEAEPEIEETVKRRVLPYFVLEGNVIALMGTKDHVNVFVYDPIAPDPEGIITDGHENDTARQIKVYEDDELNRDALKALIRAIAENNRAGGWRKLKKAGRLP